MRLYSSFVVNCVKSTVCDMEVMKEKGRWKCKCAYVMYWMFSCEPVRYSHAPIHGFQGVTFLSRLENYR